MIDVIIQSSDGLRVNIAASKAYIAHKLTGNVKAWYQNLTTAQLTELEDGIVTGSEYLKRLSKTIYQEFIGKDEVNHAEEVRLADRNNARWLNSPVHSDRL